MKVLVSYTTIIFSYGGGPWLLEMDCSKVVESMVNSLVDGLFLLYFILFNLES